MGVGGFGIYAAEGSAACLVFVHLKFMPIHRHIYALLGNDYDVALLAALCAGGSVYVLWLFLTGQLQTMLGYSKKERERA